MSTYKGADVERALLRKGFVRDNKGSHHTYFRFRAGGLHGFVFQNARPIAYHACPGRTLFFTVEGITLS